MVQVNQASRGYPENTSQWRHNESDGISNHRRLDCLLNRLFRHRSKKTSKLHVTGRCEGNSPGTGEFSTQRTSNAENVSIRWRHHVRGDSRCKIDNSFGHEYTAAHIDGLVQDCSISIALALSHRYILLSKLLNIRLISLLLIGCYLFPWVFPEIKKSGSKVSDDPFQGSRPLPQRPPDGCVSRYITMTS